MSRPAVVLRRLAAALTVLLLSSAAPAGARELFLGARVPLIVPVGISSSVGAGFTPSLQLDVGAGFGLTFTTGFIYYSDEGQAERDIPILLGAAYTFRADKKVKPYLELKLGYTYAIEAEESTHRITAMLGTGLYINLVRGMDLDLGADFIAPDLRGEAPKPVGFMLKLGARYSVL